MKGSLTSGSVNLSVVDTLRAEIGEDGVVFGPFIELLNRSIE